MERHVYELARQEEAIHLLSVELVEKFPGTVAALLGHGLEDQLMSIGLWHQVRVEGAGDICDVNDASSHRIADLERRHGAGAANVVDLDNALAVVVHLLDKPLEVLRELRPLGKGCHRP